MERIHMGNPVKHHEKYLFIDQAFKGQKYLIPQINQLHNEALILAMQQTGVKIGPNGLPMKDLIYSPPSPLYT